MRLVDLVLSWLRLRAKPTRVRRSYDRVTCPVCGRDVARSAVSQKRHKCEVSQ